MSSSKKKRKKQKLNKHDSREHISVAVVGYNGCGKSTLCGLILVKAGLISKTAVAKLAKQAKIWKRPSSLFAYIMDEDDAERQKGATMEYNHAYFETTKRRFTILDTPGRRCFFPNVIKAMAIADIAILVVSARRGEFEAGFDHRGTDGNIQQFCILARIMCISRIVTVINKMETIDDDETRYNEIKTKIQNYLTTRTGFKLKNIFFVPISAQNGENLTNKSAFCSWYSGKTLFQTLDTLKRIKRSNYRAIHRIICIDRFITDSKLTVVGKVITGTISVGENLRINPGEIRVNVPNLVINGIGVKTATCGEIVSMIFDTDSVATLDDIHSGCVMCNARYAVRTEIFAAELYVIETAQVHVSKGYKAMFHCHCIMAECEIIEIPDTVQHNTTQSAIIKLSKQCSLETDNDCSVLGRFSLRNQYRTVVIGRIMDVAMVTSDKLVFGYIRRIQMQLKTKNHQIIPYDLFFCCLVFCKSSKDCHWF